MDLFNTQFSKTRLLFDSQSYSKLQAIYVSEDNSNIIQAAKLKQQSIKGHFWYYLKNIVSG